MSYLKLMLTNYFDLQNRQIHLLNFMKVTNLMPFRFGLMHLRVLWIRLLKVFFVVVLFLMRNENVRADI